MNNKLFIIGNGFDLHHEIPSKYSQFGFYLKKIDPKIYDYVDQYLFYEEDYWSVFEERLADLNYDQIIEEAEDFLVPYGAEDWSDSYHHDFEYEIEEIVSGLSTKLRNHFANWVRSLLIPDRCPGSPLECIDTGAKFLNFNYTSTLQKLYSVPHHNVLNIHGSAADPNASIILGHGWKPSPQDKLARQIDEDTDIRVAGGYKLIDDYFAKTLKQSDLIIQSNQSFFDDLKQVTEIWVLGHSLAEVDYPYFEHVIKNTSVNTKWIVSYHTDPLELQNRFSNFGVTKGLYEFKRLRDL